MHISGSGIRIAIGGGVFVRGAFSCTDSPVSDNAADIGGGIFATSTSVDTTLTNCTVDSNTAIFGGGISFYNASAAATVINSTISGNSAQRGAGIDTKGTLTLINSTVAFNIGTGN